MLSTFFIIFLLSYLARLFVFLVDCILKYKIKIPPEKGRTKSKIRHSSAKKPKIKLFGVGPQSAQNQIYRWNFTKAYCGIRTRGIPHTSVTAVAASHRAFPQIHLYFKYIIILSTLSVNRVLKFEHLRGKIKKIETKIQRGKLWVNI